MAFLTILSLLLPQSFAYSPADHHTNQQPIQEANTDWATHHMASEHHISVFDSASFFNLHDYSSRGTWDTDDILKTYGLFDPSNAHVAPSKHEEVVNEILKLYDTNGDRYVSRDEFTQAFDKGVRLPDFGVGPGHHGDTEYEYEIHHFEKYHDENTKEEDLTHPEDIEHFKHHEEMEQLEERLEAAERSSHGVQEGNIPGKFRKGS